MWVTLSLVWRVIHGQQQDIITQQGRENNANNSRILNILHEDKEVLLCIDMTYALTPIEETLASR